MNEKELRQKFVDMAVAYVGVVEGDSRHREIVDIYNSFINSVYKAVVSILSICGYVVLFSSVISVFSQISDKYGIIKAALPFLEITNGIILLSDSHLKIAFLRLKEEIFTNAG